VVIGELRFLYVGCGDTSEAVEHHLEVLGGRLRWRFQRFGADVAAIELPGGGPLVLLADHRPTGSTLAIYAVDDLDALIDRARRAGAEVAGPLGTPEGPVVVVTLPSAAELAFLRVDRPDALDAVAADRSAAGDSA
jgi:hypothetical protein